MVAISKHSPPVARGVGILNLLTLPLTAARIPPSIFHIFPSSALQPRSAWSFFYFFFVEAEGGMRPCLFFALCETRGWVANVRLQDGSVVQTEEWATDVTHVRGWGGGRYSLSAPLKVLQQFLGVGRKEAMFFFFKLCSEI